jgi:hypothetical protein
VVGGVVQCGGELITIEVVAGDELVEVGVVAVAGVEVAEGDGGGDGVAVEGEGLIGQVLGVFDGCRSGGDGVTEADIDLPRAFRTAYLRLIYAADCRSTYSS